MNFRVKFFVSDPNKLQEEYTRWAYGTHFFLKYCKKYNEILKLRREVLGGPERKKKIEGKF